MPIIADIYHSLVKKSKQNFRLQQRLQTKSLLTFPKCKYNPREANAKTYFKMQHELSGFKYEPV